MNLDLLAQYEIPYLHPLAVHFPLVLLLLGAGVAVLYAALGRPVWRHAALAFFALGAVGAYVAQETGETLQHAVEGEPVVEAVLETHAAMGDYTLWTALVAAVGFGGIGLALRRRTPADSAVVPREPLAWRLAVLVPAVAAALLVAYTGHLGGVMVWGVPAG